MVFKKDSSASERTIFLEGDVLWIDGLPKRASYNLLHLPGRLLKEIRGFFARNSLAVIRPRAKSQEPVRGCCLSCLKAHVHRVCQKHNLSVDVEAFLAGEKGHDGYYLDRSRLVRVIS